MVIFLCLLVAQLFAAGESNQLQRIVNGQLAEEGQFPYLAGLIFGPRITLNPNNRFIWCGGSIIANEWVLTAAHCTERRPERVQIFYGSNQRQTEDQSVYSTKFYRHPKYRVIFKNNYRHDIALIRTPRIKFNDRIQSIPLPSPRDGRSIRPGQSVISAGWGATVLQGPPVDRLNWVEMEIADESVCNRRYGDNLEGILCVSTDERKSVCSGDSGGPLVLKGENKVFGIVSFGSESGCDRDEPVVFTDVITYLDWIESISGVRPE